MACRGQRSAVRRPVGLLAPLLLLAGSAVFAVATGAVEVFIDATRGAIQKIPIAGYSFKSAIAVPGQFPADVLKADLRRSLLFEVADLERFGIRAEVNSQPGPEALQKAGEAGLAVQVWGALLPRGSEIVMEGTLFESSRGEVGRKRYVGSAEVVRYMVHRLADEIVFHYTGEQGIARSQIAFVSERDGAKELFVMDYDGYNRRRLTFDASLNLAPAWSPDRRRLAFVSYRKGNDPRIEELDLITGARRPLVAFPGLNITPEWSPSGEELAFATSKDGNSEIYKVDKYGKRFERLTDHGAADLAPAWSADGRHVAFSSTRNGRRDIYMINTDGTGLERLTTGGTSNEDPAWSAP